MSIEVVSHSSPFLTPGSVSKADALAILHIKRDQQTPTILRDYDEKNEGYDEGKVTNTRFGSFPHSTLINTPWGSQVRASAVDTGTRGRRPISLQPTVEQGRKRKRDPDTPEGSTPGTGESAIFKAAVVAPTGFVHLLPPTPESWTTSLPHRTQVVYTPDYSYILQRLRVRPGTVMIEAGAGSGSFTHAAARAVFNGYPKAGINDSAQTKSQNIRGKVWSFEFHDQRAEKLQAEIRDHGLGGIVEITHRDVCVDGFAVANDCDNLVQADAIFLDLPAPWLAMRHLRRRLVAIKERTSKINPSNPENNAPRLEETTATPNVPIDKESINGSDPVAAAQVPPSPLNPLSPIRICTFSPCIEQVQKTVTTMRQQGWLEISMVEIAAKKIEVRRERVGLQEEGLHGVNASPASVDEALTKLREIEATTKGFHNKSSTAKQNRPSSLDYSDLRATVDVSDHPLPPGNNDISMTNSPLNAINPPIPPSSKQQRLTSIREAQPSRKLFKEGRLIHRIAPELKTHTSYLVFAVLPREWTAEDEERTQRMWEEKAKEVHEAGDGMGKVAASRRALKREVKKVMEEKEQEKRL